MSKLKSTPHIEVEINLDEMDLSRAESKATYEEIKEYVLKNYGMNVTNLYIAQVKRKYGIIERINYNLGGRKNKSATSYRRKGRSYRRCTKAFSNDFINSKF